MAIVIYHNPACGTSRNVVALTRAAGYAPKVVEYIDVGWTLTQLRDLFAAAGLTARDALRISKSPAEDLGLTDPGVDDETLLAAMIEHPILVNRPIVSTSKGVRLCRPAQTVLDLLDQWPPCFVKEDGEVIIDTNGKRVL